MKLGEIFWRCHGAGMASAQSTLSANELEPALSTFIQLESGSMFEREVCAADVKFKATPCRVLVDGGRG